MPPPLTHTHTLIMVLLLSTTCFHLSNTQDAQNFTYSQLDNIIIKPNTDVGLYGSLTTAADEYLSSSLINITTQMVQIGDQKDKFAPYHLLFFNLTSQQGMTCYQNYALGLPVPSSACTTITDLYHQSCHNYSNCFDQDISYSLSLNQWQYVQHMFYIRNAHDSNELNLQTKISIQLISSNAWFFWAVGLTCLLMIMIVVLTGVVFNLNLRMKRTKKLYEQYKLTVQNDIDFGIDDQKSSSKDD